MGFNLLPFLCTIVHRHRPASDVIRIPAESFTLLLSIYRTQRRAKKHSKGRKRKGRRGMYAHKHQYIKKQVSNLEEKKKTGLEKFYEDENGFSVLVAENVQNVF